MSRRSITPYLRRAAAVAVVIILLFIIKNIISSIISTHDRSNILRQLREELSQKKREKDYLTQKLYYAKTDNFVEEEARGKLGFVKEGESVVIDEKIDPVRPKPTAVSVPIWRKWWALFF